MSLPQLLRQREPILYLVTHEESRAERAILQWCSGEEPAMPLYRWSCTRGVERWANGVLEPVELPAPKNPTPQSGAPLAAVVEYLLHDCEEEGVFLLKDVHQQLNQQTVGGPTAALGIRALRDAFYELRDSGSRKKIVILAPEMVPVADLEKEWQIEDFDLPTEEELRAIISKYLRRAEAIRTQDSSFVYDVADADELLLDMARAGVGLTEVELECQLENLLYVERRLCDQTPQRLVRAKQQIIRKSGVLEYIPLSDLLHLEVGGLEQLLQWLRLRRRVFHDPDSARKQYGIDRVPRGVLLVGISGCGKSLTCKTVAREWRCPLLRLDVGAIFNRWVGSSEERIRHALKIAESVAPCVLWIDEIEKGFGGGGDSDGGTSSRVLGTFLVWMQEKRAPVFVAATANDISRVPAEMLRPGRFDKRFFVGCPGEASRREIFNIHLSARGLDSGHFDLDEAVESTLGFSGAEIEQAVYDSLYDACFEERAVSSEDLMRNIARTPPLVRSLGPQMNRIWSLLEQGRVEAASNDTLTRQEVEGILVKERSPR